VIAAIFAHRALERCQSIAALRQTTLLKTDNCFVTASPGFI
jgi:hypothetical protein